MLWVLLSLCRKLTNRDILMKPVIPVVKIHGSSTWRSIYETCLGWVSDRTYVSASVLLRKGIQDIGNRWFYIAKVTDQSSKQWQKAGRLLLVSFIKIKLGQKNKTLERKYTFFASYEVTHKVLSLSPFSQVCSDSEQAKVFIFKKTLSFKFPLLKSMMSETVEIYCTNLLTI